MLLGFNDKDNKKMLLTKKTSQTQIDKSHSTALWRGFGIAIGAMSFQTFFNDVKILLHLVSPIAHYFYARYICIDNEILNQKKDRL